MIGEHDLDPGDVVTIRAGCNAAVKLIGGYAKAARFLDMSSGMLHKTCKQDGSRLLTLAEVHVLQSAIGADPITKAMSDLALLSADGHESLSSHDRLQALWPLMRPLEEALLQGSRSRALKAIDQLSIGLHQARADFVNGRPGSGDE